MESSTQLAPHNHAGHSSAGLVVDSAQPSLREAREDEGGLPLAGLKHAIRRQWLPATVLAILCAVPLGAGAWMLQRPKYTSAAYLRVAAADTPLIFETADKAARYDFKTFKNTQRQLLLTPFVLNNALRRPGIAALVPARDQASPIEWLQRDIKVDFPGDAEIMRVALSNPDRAAAQRIVEAVVNAYLEEVIDSSQGDRVQRLDNLQKVYNEAEGKARSKRSALRKLADTLGTSDSDTLSLAQQGAVQHFGLVRSEWTKTKFELMRAEGELRYLAPAAAPTPPLTPSAGTDPQNPAIAEQTTQLPVAPGTESPPEDTVAVSYPGHSELELEGLLASDSIAAALQAEQQSFERAKQKLTASAAAEYMKSLGDRIQEVERQLNDRRDFLRRLLIERTAQGVAGSVRSDLLNPAAIKLRVAVLKQQEKELGVEVVKLEEEVKKFGRSSVDVEMMRSEIDGLDAVVKQVGAEIERTKIELKGNPRIYLQSAADVGAVLDRKMPLAITALCGLLGLVVPGGFLIWRDLHRRPVNDTTTVRDDVGLNVLGSIPRLRARALRTLPSPSIESGSSSALLRDSADSVAAMVLRLAGIQQQQVLLISSATAGEGKTSLACHLAVSMARAGHRTLIVDFDLRRPSLHKIFQHDLSPGTGEVLAGETTLEDAIKPTATEGLDLLAAGCERRFIGRDAASGALSNLFKQLRSDYEFVLVDASPILPSPDSRILAQHADGVILSVLRDVSQVGRVVDARRVLGSFGVPVLGTVLAGCSEEVYYSNRGSGSV